MNSIQNTKFYDLWNFKYLLVHCETRIWTVKMILRFFVFRSWRTRKEREMLNQAENLTYQISVEPRLVQIVWILFIAFFNVSSLSFLNFFFQKIPISYIYEMFSSEFHFQMTLSDAWSIWKRLVYGCIFVPLFSFLFFFCIFFCFVRNILQFVHAVISLIWLPADSHSKKYQ